MKIKNLREYFLYLLAIGISIFLLVFFIGSVWIGYEVNNNCQNAQRQYGGDCVEALIAQLNDDTQNYRVRNEAIWSLGQFGDVRANLTLEKYYSGDIPDREPLDKMISQYELKKAINLINGGVNLPALIWRTEIK